MIGFNISQENEFLVITEEGTTFKMSLEAKDITYEIEGDIFRLLYKGNKILGRDFHFYKSNSNTITSISELSSVVDTIKTSANTWLNQNNPSGSVVNVNTYSMCKVTNNLQTNLNNDNWTVVDFKPSAEINTNTSIFETVSGGILVKKDTLCNVTSSIYSSSDVARANLAVGLSINGVINDVEGSGGYIRAASGHNTSSTHISDIVNVSAGSVISIVAKKAGGSGLVTNLADKSILYVEAYDGYSGSVNVFFPKPILTKLNSDRVLINSLTTLRLSGGYFIEDFTLTTTSTTAQITNTKFIDGNTVEFDVISSQVGKIDLKLTTNSGEGELIDAIEILPYTWIDLRAGGVTLTSGNEAGRDVRVRSGMTMSRDSVGMYFSGAGPWSSWAKFESLGWSRGQNKTIEIVFTRPSTTFMLGIGSTATNESSTGQYSQAEVLAYFTSPTNFWGLYGNNGTLGTAGSQSVGITLPSKDFFKVKFEGDGSQFTLYSLNGGTPEFWGDESSVLSTFTVSNSLNGNQTNLLPMIIPVNGDSCKYVAININ